MCNGKSISVTWWAGSSVSPNCGWGLPREAPTFSCPRPRRLLVGGTAGSVGKLLRAKGFLSARESPNAERADVQRWISQTWVVLFRGFNPEAFCLSRAKVRAAELCSGWRVRRMLFREICSNGGGFRPLYLNFDKLHNYQYEVAYFFRCRGFSKLTCIRIALFDES